jgi:alpha-tubulin suppressor-like RCC1 family protein
MRRGGYIKPNFNPLDTPGGIAGYASYLYTWGNNGNGQLGDNTTSSKSYFSQSGTATWSTTSVGGNSSGLILGIKTDGTLWAWGYNPFGGLGLNDLVYRSSPTQIGSDTNWSSISAGQYTAFAIKTNGTLWGWGANNSGQIGLNNSTNTSSPIQIGSLTNWSVISTNNDTPQGTLAIKADGTLWGWGGNTSGQLGLNDANYRSSPTQIAVGSTWIYVAARGNHTIAIKTGGTLWTWGKNSNGQAGGTGVGNVVVRSSPVQVGALTTWSKVFSGPLNSFAIRTDGLLFGWGLNSTGAVGNNAILNRSSPTVIGALTNWSFISVGTFHTMALKTDGSLWIWGRNNNYQLGLGDSTYRSSPTQVGFITKWLSIAAGQYTSSGLAW